MCVIPQLVSAPLNPIPMVDVFTLRDGLFETYYLIIIIIINTFLYGAFTKLNALYNDLQIEDKKPIAGI